MDNGSKEIIKQLVIMSGELYKEALDLIFKLSSKKELTLNDYTEVANSLNEFRSKQLDQIDELITEYKMKRKTMKTIEEKILDFKNRINNELSSLKEDEQKEKDMLIEMDKSVTLIIPKIEENFYNKKPFDEETCKFMDLCVKLPSVGVAALEEAFGNDYKKILVTYGYSKGLACSQSKGLAND